MVSYRFSYLFIYIYLCVLIIRSTDLFWVYIHHAFHHTIKSSVKCWKLEWRSCRPMKIVDLAVHTYDHGKTAGPMLIRPARKAKVGKRKWHSFTCCNFDAERIFTLYWRERETGEQREKVVIRLTVNLYFSL